jgi:hypothetical protein
MCKRALKLFNGRGQYHEASGLSGHLYIAAYSVADALRVLMEHGFESVSRREINEYFAECWGNSMDGVQPERGVWTIDDNPEAKPKRVKASNDYT